MLIGHKNVSKFIYNAEFQGKGLHNQREKYFIYIENFMKELIENVVT